MLSGGPEPCAVFSCHAETLVETVINIPLAKITEHRYIFGMDWKKIITEIKQRHGLTQAEIARSVGCSQVSISELETGTRKEPRYAVGASLMALHRRSKRKQPAEA